ncbi:Alginate export [Mucilaginibacter pineti]|uniref:Alginate export n=1 Tax=Mucilaginibacter pineti TaxID=1391627 RepID=A0A1G6ZHW2_9SPHI|nr:alginate export family protein [Mucilaginibacter pineti]SDE02304.1 Alginate export [Mucilaginibacter pineti]
MKNYLFAFIILLSSGAVFGQEVPFKLLRYDENYTYLAKDTSNSWYHLMKFNPVSANKKTYFSFGGEVRYQYFHFKNEDWGEAANDKDGFVLTRYIGHVDFHAGKQFRTYIELQSSLANGQMETPSPVDNNPLDLHQAFIDLSAPISNNQNLTLRLGRQELSYGSQRLVAVREAPNNRQSFDAAKVMYNATNVKLDMFYSHYVQARPGIFDDAFNHNTQFWGVYTTINKVPLLQNADLYYLGIWKKSAMFDDGAASEMRHSIGTRIWMNSPTWQYDLEGVYQFGKLATSDISAWTASSNVSYTFHTTRLKPQLGLKTEAISGDKKYNDGRLNTFNPLFPRGSYFGLAALIGPANLFDAHPYYQLSLSKKLVFAQDYDLFWRMSRNDGLYAVNGRLLYSGKNINSKKVGRQLGTSLEYTPNKFLYFREELTWFSAGEYLKETGPGKDIVMLGSTITLKF